MTVGTAMPNTGRRAPDDFRMQRQPRVSRRTCLGVAACLVFGLVGLVPAAEAQIVALGASNTRGMGVASEAAYPAQLEAILRPLGKAPVQVIQQGKRSPKTLPGLAWW